MFRKNLCVLCIMVLAVVSLGAGGEKKKSGGGLDSLDTKSVNVTASEGSTAMALRGIVEPEGTTCCAVLGGDAAKGIVTVRMRKTGAIFNLFVPATLFSEIYRGDAVKLNLATQSGTIDGVTGEFRLQNREGALCCEIASMRGDTVTVKEAAVGRTFQFKAPADVLSKLQVGQKVQADFKARSASVVGLTSALSISNLSQPASP